MKKTVLLKVDPQAPDIEKVRVAARFIRSGGSVAFPTETVYGLGADALNATAVLALFEAKKRPLDNPPIVHVCDVKDVYRVAQDVPAMAEELMRLFWPGPLTLILKRSRIVPDVAVAGLDTIAVRMPRHSVALALIRESQCPISAPSANLAGKPSPTGGTPFEVLKGVLSGVELSPAVTAERPVPVEKVRSPGLKHKHYAPDADVVVVEGELSAIVGKVNELAMFYVRRGSRVGVLCTDETAGFYRADVVKSLGSRSDMGSVARSLFARLREFDLEGVDVIVAEGVPLEGLGLAVMNRLRRAAGYNIVKAS
jgi:L-threonylcarbamoyladenylate synthase